MGVSAREPSPHRLVLGIAEALRHEVDGLVSLVLVGLPAAVSGSRPDLGLLGKECWREAGAGLSRTRRLQLGARLTPAPPSGSPPRPGDSAAWEGVGAASVPSRPAPCSSLLGGLSQEDGQGGPAYQDLARPLPWGILTRSSRRRTAAPLRRPSPLHSVCTAELHSEPVQLMGSVGKPLWSAQLTRSPEDPSTAPSPGRAEPGSGAVGGGHGVRSGDLSLHTEDLA